MGTHSKIISGSTALRRLNCTASASLEASMPPEPSNAHALKGSALHAMMYHALDSDTMPKPAVFTDERGSVEITDGDLATLFWPALNAVRTLMRRHKVVEYDLEIDVALRKTCGDSVYGTVDFVGISEIGYPVVADFKFGQGVPENAEENYQLSFYALGLIESSHEYMQNTGKIVMAIIHPFRGRVDVDDVLDEWETTSWYMESFRQLTANAFAAITHGVTSFQTGRWCQFCRARAICPEQLEAIDRLSAELHTPPEHMSAARIANLLKKGEGVTAAYEALKAYAQKQAENGAVIPGYKLIRSVGNRRFVNEETAGRVAASLLGTKAFDPQQLRSPAQLETECRKAGVDFSVLAKHVERPERGYSLVPASHKGAAVPPPAAVDAIELPGEIIPIERGKK